MEKSSDEIKMEVKTNERLGVDELLSGLGRTEELGSVLSCRIGDMAYGDLVAGSKRRLDSRAEREIGHHKRELKVVRSGVVESEIRTSQKRLDFFKATRDVDYSSRVKDSLEGVSRDRMRNFNGLPFYLFDSHLHSYSLIRDLLLQADEKMTIVRFDQHADSENLGDVPNRSNYVSHLVSEKEVRDKITEIITVSGGMPGKVALGELTEKVRDREVYSLNGISHTLTPIKALPVIGGPVLLDVDLDGHEETNQQGHCGGYWLVRSGLRLVNYDNQQCIVLHPEATTRILRTQLKDVKEIYVATERGWRNRLFHDRIEFDFLESLVV